MSIRVAKLAATAIVMAVGASAAMAQFDPDEEFLQCMNDCQDWQPNQQLVWQCENWCYEYYNHQ